MSSLQAEEFRLAEGGSRTKGTPGWYCVVREDMGESRFESPAADGQSSTFYWSTMIRMMRYYPSNVTRGCIITQVVYRGYTVMFLITAENEKKTCYKMY